MLEKIKQYIHDLTEAPQDTTADTDEEWLTFEGDLFSAPFDPVEDDDSHQGF